MKRNEGYQPSETKARLTNQDGPSVKAKRIRGMLRNGQQFGFEPRGPGQEKGWAAETSRWTLDGSPHDIIEWEIAT